MAKVLCMMKSCEYYTFIPQEKGLYRHQCGNDEIEIDNFSDTPCCFTYENRLKGRKLKEERKNESKKKTYCSRSRAIFP
jgi:hypothetical protein